MKIITKFIYPALATIAFACFALCPTPNAFGVSPPPDGGYPNWNTAEGQYALFSLTTGAYNTALGGQALYRNTTGGSNTATGLNALFSNTGGSGNTASGFGVLYSNTTGQGNTANGYQALYHNTTGTNTATGYRALFSNTTGTGNSATGFQALYNNTAGTGNTALGSQALQANTSNSNTAVGRLALANNTSGSSNIALGQNAGQNITTGAGNIDIGNAGGSGDNGIIRIGNIQSDAFIAGLAHFSPNATSIAGIKGTVVTGATVLVSASGQLGVMGSSQRFKDDIKPMDKASEAILALKPVSFRYKSEIDADGSRQFGLVAEDVAKVDPDLVVCDADGKVYTVRYEAVNAMLLNEFLKEHSKVQQLEANAANQQNEIDALKAELKEQKAFIQRVNDKVELDKPAPQTVANNQ
jgi:hypothetical protein